MSSLSVRTSYSRRGLGMVGSSWIEPTHRYVGRPIGHEGQGVVDDFEPEAFVVGDVGAIRSLQVARHTIAIGPAENGFDQLGTKPAALRVGANPEHDEIPVGSSGCACSALAP